MLELSLIFHMPHAKNFKNLNQIADAKSEIINNINSNGSIVLNADDFFFKKHKRIALNKNLKIYSFSLRKPNTNVCHKKKLLN